MIAGKSQAVVFTAAASALLLAASLAAQGQSPRELLAEGNDLLEAGRWQEALESFQQAEVSLPDSPVLAYDEAIAYYRLGDYEKARQQLQRALATRDVRLEAKAKYNLGNCAYAEALALQASPQQAIDRLRQAINHYRDALAIDANDDDARANIEMATLLIKDLLDKLKQQQEQQKQKQDQQQSSTQPSANQNQQESPQSQPTSQPSQPDQQPQQDQQQKQQPQAGEQSQQQEQQGETKPQMAEQRRMTEEEARRLLQQVRDREQEYRNRKLERVRAQRPPVDKDW
jgi:Ca-activated chloride channel family protein